MSGPKKLRPATNAAAYPTLTEARSTRRVLLAAVGAAALSAGANACGTATGGVSIGDTQPPPMDGGVMAMPDGGQGHPGSDGGALGGDE